MFNGNGTEATDSRVGTAANPDRPPHPRPAPPRGVVGKALVVGAVAWGLVLLPAVRTAQPGLGLLDTLRVGWVDLAGLHLSLAAAWTLGVVLGAVGGFLVWLRAR